MKKRKKNDREHARQNNRYTGSHNEMMDPGHMEKNARLMENILDNAFYREVL
jgi:hypothetical protein